MKHRSTFMPVLGMLVANLFAACSEEAPTSIPVDRQEEAAPPWLRIESEGVGVLRLGTPAPDLHGIEWSPGPVVDGLLQVWECGDAVGYKYGGIIACFTGDASGELVLDFLVIHPPHGGRTSSGIGIGTPISQVEGLLSESSDYFLPEFGVVCLGKRELRISGRNAVASMTLGSFLDDAHDVCPEHRFSKD